MPAYLSSNTIVLQPDNIGYQSVRIPLSAAPPNTNTMVFYYKAYAEGMPSSVTEDGTNYGWNNDAYFGLSFNGSVSANEGGIVGWTNTTTNDVAVTQGNLSYPPLLNNSGYANFVPLALIVSGSQTFSYGHSAIATVYTLATNAKYFCPTTNAIELTGAQRFLGIVKISKHNTNAQQISISYGTNWENMPNSNFTTALTSLSTNWVFQNVALTETTNFRPNFASPSLSATINFPRWIVAKWPSAVPNRNFNITSARIEYYDAVF